MKKPSFNVSQDGKTVEVDGTVYSLIPKQGSFSQLFQGDYGQGFRQGTFGEQLTFRHALEIHEDISEAKAALEVARRELTLGNTVFYRGRYLFAVDNLDMVEEGGLGKMIVRETVAGGDKINGVFFSKNGNLRAIPYQEDITEEYNAFLISGSTYPVFATGDRMASEKLAKILDKTKDRIFLSVPRNELTFPAFGNIGHKLQVFGGNYARDYPQAISFGVRKSN